MGNLKDTILVVDDEPHNMQWIADYLTNIGYCVVQSTNLSDAVEKITTDKYRAVIVDLNIPLGQGMEDKVEAKGAQYKRYPGLYAAELARNQGYRTRQVVIYSVHEDAGVAEVVDMLRCTYLLKGRPRQFRSELEEVLSYDPTER